MKKHFLLLSALAFLVPSCSSAAQRPAPTWSASADGFASVVGEDGNGTTGGAGGKVVTVDNLADLEKYALAPEPLVILIKGTIVKEPFGKAIIVASNKTFLGLGKDATLLHGEFQLKPNTSNVIFRNLTIRDSWMPDDPGGKKFDFDAIQIDTSHHVWIDHCLLTHMEDGLIDFRKGSDYLTVSWSVLSNHNKAFGVGWTTDPTKGHVTIHHTWIHDTNQRNPSLDNGTGHLYNNWLQNISAYGNYSRGKSKLVVENSVFEKVNNPLVCGPDAEMVSRGNSIKDSPTTEPETSKLKGKAFDPKSFYAYTLDETASVPDLLREHGGPQASIGTSEMGAQMAALPAKPTITKAATTSQVVAPQSAGQPVVGQNAQGSPKEGIVKTINPDGTGDFKTIQEAINSVPDHNTTPIVFKIAPGTYGERVYVPRGRDFISLQGTGKKRTDVLVTGGADKNAVLKVSANDFRAENFTVENTAGATAGPQQALYGDGKRQIFENLLIKGWQDTLGSWNGNLAYFHKCAIWGSVDFIYSGGTALFEACDLVEIRDTGGVYTAPSTPKDAPYGLVFLGCRLLKGPDVKTTTTALGRPWREDGATTFINCSMDTHIADKGWSEWDGREKTARSTEYGSKRLDGTPIDLSHRAPWVKVLTDEEAAKYTATNILGGWNPRPNESTMNTAGNRVQHDIAYTQTGNQTLHLDAYRPSGAGPFPVAIVIHGGGWGSGDKRGDTQPLCEALCDANMVCIALDYRLSPAHRWPACFEDVQTALSWTKSHVAQFNGAPERIALVGYSAGGQLACLTALQGDAAVKAVVALAAPTDLVADVKRRGEVSPALKDLIGAQEQELSPTVERQLAAMSPLNFVRAGLPPFLLLHGTADQSVPFAQSVTFQEKLRAAGTSCELHVLEAAPHRLSRWAEFDPHYTEKMTTWLQQTLNKTS